LNFLRTTLLLLLAGCAQGRLTGPIDPDQAGLQLPLRLEPGKTKREDILLAMGPPSAKFEGERIFSYRLQREGEKLAVVPPIPDRYQPEYSTWANASHNVILVFDAASVLSKVSLLRMK
jgi:hypothetical protein